MPIEPPFPGDLLDQLRVVLEHLRRQAAVHPRATEIPVAIGHLEAAITAVEPLVKRSAAT